MDKKKDLTLVEQPAAYGQHLHEGPQLLMLREKLGQVLAAEEASRDGTVSTAHQTNQSRGRREGSAETEQSSDQELVASNPGEKSVPVSVGVAPNLGGEGSCRGEALAVEA